LVPVDDVQVLPSHGLRACHYKIGRAGRPFHVGGAQRVLFHETKRFYVADPDAETLQLGRVYVVDIHLLHHRLSLKHNPPPRLHAREQQICFSS
jgi:hypothetical protein